jgi:hypothetical protein
VLSRWQGKSGSRPCKSGDGLENVEMGREEVEVGHAKVEMGLKTWKWAERIRDKYVKRNGK